ncbi:hypothetical protein ACFQY4_02455 [Catellatospora bangladeshensis]|uniref:Uncharacterized protein n=1 Tax=Catellatospora bangladeshensis TaxID=310355 RepID=A0A8J3NFM8_9ACTN|nr:hypothetical protein [Catellatospora bangladeshensis]GIF79512.1 hypothetical protein Cba03nite_08610 [Catellatospora bangladeshensis]
MSHFPDLVARMAADPDFARRVRADVAGTAAAYGLTPGETEQLRGLTDAAVGAGPTALNPRLSRSGIGTGGLAGLISPVEVPDLDIPDHHDVPSGDGPGDGPGGAEEIGPKQDDPAPAPPQLDLFDPDGPTGPDDGPGTVPGGSGPGGGTPGGGADDPTGPALQIGPKQDDPSGPALEIGPKQDDPSGPALEIGPKQDDPSGPALEIGPKQDDPAPTPPQLDLFDPDGPTGPDDGPGTVPGGSGPGGGTPGGGADDPTGPALQIGPKQDDPAPPPQLLLDLGPLGPDAPGEGPEDGAGIIVQNGLLAQGGLSGFGAPDAIPAPPGGGLAEPMSLELPGGLPALPDGDGLPDLPHLPGLPDLPLPAPEDGEAPAVQPVSLGLGPFTDADDDGVPQFVDVNDHDPSVGMPPGLQDDDGDGLVNGADPDWSPPGETGPSLFIPPNLLDNLPDIPFEIDPPADGGAGDGGSGGLGDLWGFGDDDGDGIPDFLDNQDDNPDTTDEPFGDNDGDGNPNISDPTPNPPPPPFHPGLLDHIPDLDILLPTPGDGGESGDGGTGTPGGETADPGTPGGETGGTGTPGEEGGGTPGGETGGGETPGGETGGTGTPGGEGGGGTPGGETGGSGTPGGGATGGGSGLPGPVGGLTPGDTAPASPVVVQVVPSVPSDGAGATGAASPTPAGDGAAPAAADAATEDGIGTRELLIGGAGLAAGAVAGGIAGAVAGRSLDGRSDEDTVAGGVAPA